MHYIVVLLLTMCLNMLNCFSNFFFSQQAATSDQWHERIHDDPTTMCADYKPWGSVDSKFRVCEILMVLCAVTSAVNFTGNAALGCFRESSHQEHSRVTTRLEALLKRFGGAMPTDKAILEELNDEAENSHSELSWYDEDEDNEFENERHDGE